MEFTEDQISRYSRHILLPEVGEAKGKRRSPRPRFSWSAQEALVRRQRSIWPQPVSAPSASSIAMSWTSPIFNGRFSTIHRTWAVPKFVSGKEKIQALNPDVQVSMYEERLTAGNALKIISDYDIVIDGVDNFTAKFLINDACFFAGKPLVHGGILRFDGRVTTIVPKQSACYRCVFKTPPPAGLVASCQEAGVIGVLAGIIGTIQATEALKLILGIGHPLTNRFLDFDARKTQFREIKVKRNPDCALCGAHPTITELFDDGDPFAGCAVRP